MDRCHGMDRSGSIVNLFLAMVKLWKYHPSINVRSVAELALADVHSLSCVRAFRQVAIRT